MKFITFAVRHMQVKPEEIESYEELNKRLTDDSNTGAEPQVILQWAEAISSVLNQNQTTPDTREEKEQVSIVTHRT